MAFIEPIFKSVAQTISSETSYEVTRSSEANGDGDSGSLRPHSVAAVHDAGTESPVSKVSSISNLFWTSNPVPTWGLTTYWRHYVKPNNSSRSQSFCVQARPTLMTPRCPHETGDPFLAEFQQAQSCWQQLSAYEEMLEAELQIIDLQMEQFMSVEGALDEEERQREEDQRLFESYMTHSEWLFREAAVRLQLILEFLLLLCKSSGFPDGDRPMCMTMPWNILPALVVLWGVCWMFYNTPQDYVDSSAFQYPSLDENILNPIAGKSTQISNGHCFILTLCPRLVSNDQSCILLGP